MAFEMGIPLSVLMGEEEERQEPHEIRMIARAGQKMDPEKRQEMLRVLKAIYPEEFGDNK